MLESRLHAREWRGKNAQPLRVIPQDTFTSKIMHLALDRVKFVVSLPGVNGLKLMVM